MMITEIPPRVVPNQLATGAAPQFRSAAAPEKNSSQVPLSMPCGTPAGGGPRLKPISRTRKRARGQPNPCTRLPSAAAWIFLLRGRRWPWIRCSWCCREKETSSNALCRNPGIRSDFLIRNTKGGWATLPDIQKVGSEKIAVSIQFDTAYSVSKNSWTLPNLSWPIQTVP